MKSVIVLLVLAVSGLARADVPTTVPWFEFHVESFSQSYDFYSKVFGWTCHMTSATSCDLLQSGVPIGEIIEKHPAPVGTAVLIYINVDDVVPVYNRALELGATSVYAPMKVPSGQGSIAVFRGKNEISLGLYSTKPISGPEK